VHGARRRPPRGRRIVVEVDPLRNPGAEPRPSDPQSDVQRAIRARPGPGTGSSGYP